MNKQNITNKQNIMNKQNITNKQNIMNKQNTKEKTESENKYLEKENKYLESENKYLEKENKYLEKENKYLEKENKYLEKFEYENKYSEKGIQLIAGVDEVGRGPLAGPVVCCAVIMSLEKKDIILGIDDSKKLSEKKRIELYDKIKEKAISYKICQIEHDEIDQINILNATKKCMKMCIEGLEILPKIVLIDAVKVDIDIPQENIIKGDLKSYTIGCASILAKVYRDRLMEEYDAIYLGYNFKKNKGYGTAEHIEAIREKGICKIHRKTFTKNFLEKAEK